MTWDIKIDKSYVEWTDVYHLLPQYTRGLGLDIGSGPSRAFRHWTTFDQQPGVADLHGDALHIDMIADGTMDFVFSSHCIEHIADTKAALTEWWRLVKPGGNLVLYYPDEELYPKVGEHGANPDHKVNLNAQKIRDAMPDGWDLLEEHSRSQADQYSVFQVFRKRADKENHLETLYKRSEKELLVIRYGGYGDAIWMSGALKMLKKEGWTITLNTLPNVYEIMKHVPFVDRWIIQDNDQVPNDPNLRLYWNEMGKERYDRVINLSESVEGDILLLPDRIQYTRPHEVRHKLCNFNYLERTYDICEVAHDFSGSRFYATKEETETALAWRARNPGPLIVWSLRGSAVHKVYPFMDAAVCGVLENTDARIVLTADFSCKALEDQIRETVARLYGETDRVTYTSDDWLLRSVYALAENADIVVGPETGLLNVVAMLPNVQKVIYLSHSSVENATKNWVRTTALSVNIPCYPCHRLHHNFDYCTEDEEFHAALCASSITPVSLVSVITERLKDALRDPDRSTEHSRIDQELVGDGRTALGADIGGSGIMDSSPAAGPADAIYDHWDALLRSGRDLIADGLHGSEDVPVHGHRKRKAPQVKHRGG